jgi:peptide/nickel transport system substrate-binding protein
MMKERVAAVETPDERTVRFVLKAPWPDFLTFYSSATGAGWIVPRKYVEKVGDEGFKKAPVGAGPYRFVSFTPGVEMVMEAFEGYWRKTPPVKRLLLKGVPEEATRLAALKRGEIDIGYSIRGELAEELRRTPGLSLKPVVIQGTFWLYFADQWDPKSPWHDQRTREAARLAIDYKSISEALTLGYSPITNSIIPESFEFFWKPPSASYDPARAKTMLADAGHRDGFDAGDYYCDASYANVAEAVINNLQEAGIRVKLRPLERAAFYAAYSEKKLKNVIQGASGAFGNAATRLAAFAVKGGAYCYGNYPEIDELYAQQAAELDQAKRTELLHRAQQVIHEKSMYAPIWQLAFLNGVGNRVGESGLGLIKGHAYSAPYEDVTIKKN